jgi:hypothetical protein
MSVGGAERRTCRDEKSDTVDNKEDVCQQVAGGSLPPTESHGFVLQLLCAHCHRVPVFCSTRLKVVTRDEYRSLDFTPPSIVLHHQNREILD